jgi:hypothetical protein
MISHKLLSSFVLCAVVAVPGLAAAQDYTLPASYGEYSLSSGFTPDPMYIDVSSGGRIDASRLGGNCRGFIANAPDVQVTYDASILSLWVSVISTSDTTLVVNTPTGGWICDDDSGGDLDPSIHFTGAQSGVYDIWVGTYGGTNNESARVYFSELGPYGN